VAAHAPAGWGVAGSLGSLLLVGIAGVAVTGAQEQSQPVVKLDTVWIDTVRRGDMKLEVRALGRLTSRQTVALKVAQTHIQNVRQGEPAMIAFPHRKEMVGGTVAVVHPEVVNGTLIVDVRISDALPSGVNLQEPVDGIITVGGLKDVVYVGRPAVGPPNSQVMLFKLEPDGHSAKKVSVQFGAASVNVIEIKSGLQPGDKVIISDMSQHDGVAAIVLR